MAKEKPQDAQLHRAPLWTSHTHCRMLDGAHCLAHCRGVCMCGKYQGVSLHELQEARAAGHPTACSACIIPCIFCRDAGVLHCAVKGLTCTLVLDISSGVLHLGDGVLRLGLWALEQQSKGRICRSRAGASCKGTRGRMGAVHRNTGKRGIPRAVVGLE